VFFESNCKVSSLNKEKLITDATQMMRKMNKTILSALIGLSCSFAASNTFAEDLLQVFEIATANDPTVLKAKSTADAQAYGIDRAMSSLLPSINFTMGYEKSDSNGFEFNEDTLQFDSKNTEGDVFTRVSLYNNHCLI
jgi:outer membrane protein